MQPFDLLRSLRVSVEISWLRRSMRIALLVGAMPVTLPAHAAAVLPFVRLRSLHATALVVGSCAPDMAYLIGKYGAFLHTPQGIVFGCVPLGLFALVWAEALLLPALRASLPSWGGLQWARFAGSRGLPAGFLGWMWAALSIAIGAATHVMWDGFTHRGQWPASVLYANVMVDFTGESMSMPAFLQWASSFVGTAIVATWMLLHYRSLPRIAGGSTKDFARIALPTIAAAGMGAILKLSTGSLWHTFWGAASAAFLGLTAACLVFLAPSRSRSVSASE